MSTDVEPLDLLIASMIAESGEPDRAAEAWADAAVVVARATGGSAGALSRTPLPIRT
jgi:tellurite resistance protein